ncbi:MAG TPA: MFS transporter, partial [Candidatus Acidoferrales bacterium]|nr:MFS transporter [Candidatus Acidoferrales bacterium]
MNLGFFQNHPLTVRKYSTSLRNVNFSKEPSRSPDSKRILATAGVMLVILLFAIDATIVSTSMPTIVSKLGGFELYSWVFSVYMLTSALATPIFGKLSDLFGRRNLMLTGIGIFLLGSTLCGAAQNMEMMVAFRAIQGLGGGAIYALAFIIVGTLYPLHERARMQGIISSIWGVASILGPLAGGLIVERWSWRWIFFVNLPVTAAASALIVFGMKEIAAERRKPKLDLPGAATLLCGLMLLFYALSLSADANQPLDAKACGLAALALAILVIFSVIERKAAEPIIPTDLFKVKLFKTSILVTMLASMGVFG